MKEAERAAQQKKYFREVKRRLKCSGRLRRQILDNLKSAMEESPEADRAGLERRFGTPQQFVQNIKENMDPEQLAKERTHCLKIAILVLALAAAVLGAGLAWFCATDGVLILRTKTTIVYLPDDAPYPEASLEDAA